MAWIAQQTGQSLEDLERVVNKESGLLGISGISSDLRALEKAWHEGNERAQLAIHTFVHRIARHIAGTRRRCTAWMVWSLPAALAKTQR